MIMKQIHFVHRENAAMSRGQQAGFVHHLADAQRLPQIKRADHSIFGGTHWKFNQPRGARPQHRMIMGPVRARLINVQRITTEAAALDHVNVGQYLCQSAHHGGLRCALLAAYQNAAHFRRDGGQDQRECHVFGTDDCGERKRPHLTPFLRVSTPAACLGRPAYAGRDDDRRSRRPDFPDLLLTTKCPGHSGGTAPDLHRIPLPSPP